MNIKRTLSSIELHVRRMIYKGTIYKEFDTMIKKARIVPGLSSN